MSTYTVDTEVMDAVQKLWGEGVAIPEPEAEAKTEAKDVEPRVAQPETSTEAGVVMFSDKFWKPKLVPDFPIPVFEDEDWDENVRPFIPSPTRVADINYSWPKEEAELFVSSVVRGGNRCLLHGPTGTGKTTLPEMVCSVLRIPFIRVSGYQEMKPSAYIGKDTVKVNPITGLQEVVYEASNLVHGARHGAMIVLDEYNRVPPATNMAIQSLTERNGTLTLQDAAGLSPIERRITPPEGRFWLVATDNTNGLGDSSGNYSAEVQDLSTLDRITSAIYINYLPEKVEQSIVLKSYPAISDQTAKDMVRVAKYIRDAFVEHKLMQTMSPRALLSWAAHATMYGNVELGFKVAFLGKLDDDCKVVVKEIYHQVTAIELNG